jgi:hypothetical protein
VSLRSPLHAEQASLAEQPPKARATDLRYIDTLAQSFALASLGRTTRAHASFRELRAAHEVQA